uniref:Protein transport protein SEC23 n=1 Tax=Phaseolus vulgaris TaxID=3885 RepID=V7BPQ6_PHAVU|nr:hypothetical protein PHAVU_006G052000g [Phaseolus vulgaris]ESW18566.1 hypothetical protein PHAVU_006G052000g [Phaseolus vulgaris]
MHEFEFVIFSECCNEKQLGFNSVPCRFMNALNIKVGVAEIKFAVEKTGGLVVLSESFGHSVFKDSFKRVFENGGTVSCSFYVCFTGTLEINCSKEIKIQGVIGPCTSLEKKGPSVADSIIGEGNTTAWKMCVLDKSTCLTVMFDLSSSDRANTPGAVNPQLYLQFLTSYQDPTGQSVLRVTTVTRRGVDSTVSSEELVQGFDQETAEVVMARFASLKMESEQRIINNAHEMSAGSDVIFTDVVSLQVFFEHLQRLAVQS